MRSVRRARIDTGAQGAPTLVALLALACLALAACSEVAEEKPQASVLAPPVLVESVRLRDVTDRIKATGELTAQAEATVAAQVEGQISEIRVREGEARRPGPAAAAGPPPHRLVRGRARLPARSCQCTETSICFDSESHPSAWSTEYV